jgi:ribosome-binding factor A
MTHGRARTPGQRQLRMGEIVRHALVEVIARGGFRDPVLADAAITVTEVRPSPDLKSATVYVTPLGGENIEAVVAALERASGYFQGQIGRMIEAKFTPRLTFRADRSFESAERIEALLRETAAAHGEEDTNGRS